MMSLPIIWQRLVSSDGKTCDRCNATYQEMQQAVSKLKEALRPLSIEPTLEVREIDQKSFEANPSESNRIWIAGQTDGGMARCESWKQSVLLCVWRIRVSNRRGGGNHIRDYSRRLFLRAALIASSELLELAPVA